MPASSIFHPNSDEFQFLEILIDGEVLLSVVALAGFGFIGAAGTSRTVVPGMLGMNSPLFTLSFLRGEILFGLI